MHDCNPKILLKPVIFLFPPCSSKTKIPNVSKFCIELDIYMKITSVHLCCHPFVTSWMRAWYPLNSAQLILCGFFHWPHLVTIAGAPWQVATINQARDWGGPQCAFENKKVQLRVRRNLNSGGYLSPSTVPFRMWINYQSKHRWFIFAITQWTNQIHLQNGPIKSDHQSMWMNFKNWK